MKLLYLNVTSMSQFFRGFLLNVVLILVFYFARAQCCDVSWPLSHLLNHALHFVTVRVHCAVRARLNGRWGNGKWRGGRLLWWGRLRTVLLEVSEAVY